MRIIDFTITNMRTSTSSSSSPPTFDTILLPISPTNPFPLLLFAHPSANPYPTSPPTTPNPTSTLASTLHIGSPGPPSVLRLGHQPYPTPSQPGLTLVSLRRIHGTSATTAAAGRGVMVNVVVVQVALLPEAVH